MLKLTPDQLDAIEREQFVECHDCAIKPGQPVLCVPCLHNRDLITRLQEVLREARRGRLSRMFTAVKGLFS